MNVTCSWRQTKYAGDIFCLKSLSPMYVRRAIKHHLNEDPPDCKGQRGGPTRAGLHHSKPPVKTQSCLPSLLTVCKQAGTETETVSSLVLL